jgi:hypothetical protein
MSDSHRRRVVAPSLTLVTIAGLVSAAPVLAQAVDEAGRPILPRSQAGPHVVVHYAVAPDPAAITDQAAGNLVGLAERAWATIVDRWGWPAPPPDGALGGDARLDYYVVSLPGTARGVSRPQTAQAATPSFELIDRSRGIELHTVAHELLHASQNATAATAETWLKEGTAEWAALGYVEIRGSRGRAPCRRTTLRLEVAVPSGAGATPSYWSPATRRATSLRGARRAIARIPWNTCTSRGLLALPNGSATTDGLKFTVRTSVAAPRRRGPA